MLVDGCEASYVNKKTPALPTGFAISHYLGRRLVAWPLPKLPSARCFVGQFRDFRLYLVGLLVLALAFPQLCRLATNRLVTASSPESRLNIPTKGTPASRGVCMATARQQDRWEGNNTMAQGILRTSLCTWPKYLARPPTVKSSSSAT